MLENGAVIMKISNEARENGYSVSAARFFLTYNKYMEEKDEYGLGIANGHTFDRFAEIGEGIPQKLLEEYKVYRDQLREYYRKTGHRWEGDSL